MVSINVKYMHFFFSEILRVIDALQLVDKYKIISTPVNWIVSTYLFSTRGYVVFQGFF